MSTQHTQESALKFKFTQVHSNGQVYLSEGVPTRHPQTPPLPDFDSWPLASYQQIAHGLGHPPDLALTESPLGLESPELSAPEPRRNPGGHVLANMVRCQVQIVSRKPNCLKTGLNMH